MIWQNWIRSLPFRESKRLAKKIGLARFFKKYGNPRSSYSTHDVVEEIVAGMRKDAIDKQRSLIISTRAIAGIVESLRLS